MGWDVTEKKLAEVEAAKQQQMTIHKSKLARIGKIAAGVDHEINNPLSIIIGNVEKLTQLNLARFADEDLSPGLERIMLSSERISNIVTGLRMYARTDNKTATFCLAETVKESTMLPRDIYAMDGIGLEVSGDYGTHYYVEANKGKRTRTIPRA
ncbi:MAG: C4-dicarboxylate-specific signal transduction histidine kinase [Candidatus Azotimanducaceae bacterium]